MGAASATCRHHGTRRADAQRPMARRGGRLRHRSRRISDLPRSGQLTEEEFLEIEGGFSRTDGHCNVMGTASTMTSLAEALGMTLTGAAPSRPPTPAVWRLPTSGRRIVELVHEDLRPRRSSLRAGDRERYRVAARDRRLDQRRHPPAGDRRPSRHRPAARALRRDLAHGPVPGQFQAVRPVPDGGLLSRRRRAGRDGRDPAISLRPRRADRDRHDPGREPARASRPRRQRSSACARTRCSPEGGIVILRGTLAPGSAVIKRSAASGAAAPTSRPRRTCSSRAPICRAYRRRGSAGGRDHRAGAQERRAPRGAWHARVGPLPIPAKLLRQGVTDMRAHQRRAHERHLLRHRRAAHHAGGCRRRAARGRADRRRDRAERRRAPTRPARARPRSCSAAGSRWPPPSSHPARLRPALHRQRARRRRRPATSTSWAPRHQARRLWPLYARMGHS